MFFFSFLFLFFYNTETWADAARETRQHGADREAPPALAQTPEEPEGGTEKGRTRQTRAAPRDRPPGRGTSLPPSPG